MEGIFIEGFPNGRYEKIGVPPVDWDGTDRLR